MEKRPTGQLTKKINCARRGAPKTGSLGPRGRPYTLVEPSLELPARARIEGPVSREMGCKTRGESAQKPGLLRAIQGVGFLAVALALSPYAAATHEADHRFTVEGVVCAPDGKPVADEQVIVKDTRVSVKASAYTDSDGYYRATLHLHNDNLGDPIRVTVQDKQEHTKVQFDPKDTEAERIVRVDFGSGCERTRAGIILWVSIGAGVAVAIVAGVAGAKAIRKHRRRSQQKGKGYKKQRPT